GAGVEEPVDALPCRELPARPMAFQCTLAAAGCDHGRALAELTDECLHPHASPLERLIPGHPGLQHGHALSLNREAFGRLVLKTGPPRPTRRARHTTITRRRERAGKRGRPKSLLPPRRQERS